MVLCRFFVPAVRGVVDIVVCFGSIEMELQLSALRLARWSWIFVPRLVRRELHAL